MIKKLFSSKLMVAIVAFNMVSCSVTRDIQTLVDGIEPKITKALAATKKKASVEKSVDVPVEEGVLHQPYPIDLSDEDILLQALIAALPSIALEEEEEDLRELESTTTHNTQESGVLFESFAIDLTFDSSDIPDSGLKSKPNDSTDKQQQQM